MSQWSGILLFNSTGTCARLRG